MARRESWEPAPDGTIEVQLDCGKCIAPVDQKKFRHGSADLTCPKNHKTLRKDKK